MDIYQPTSKNKKAPLLKAPLNRIRTGLTLLMFTLWTFPLWAQQNVGIGTTTPHTSAALEIQSNNKGLLIPRMTSTERLAISPLVEGLLVYDKTLHTFYYYTNSNWVELGVSNLSVIADSDDDTKIQVEETADEDIIRFDLNGSEKMVLRQNANNNARLEVLNNRTSVYIGESSGKATTTGTLNTFSGYQSGAGNTSGFSNTFIGGNSGTGNTSGSLNSFFGSYSGTTNTTGAHNTFDGAYSGASNTTGWKNTFSGYQAGYANTSGAQNVMLGSGTGFSSITGNQNVYLGVEAGGSATGSGNVFLGYQAGISETGSNRLYIENSGASASTALIYGQFDKDILRFNASVGIGTPGDPGGDLEIQGTATDAKLKVGGTGGDANHLSSAREMVLNATADATGTNPLFLFRSTSYSNLANHSARMSILNNGAVGIGTEAPHASAALEINSSGRGLLIPRMTSSVRKNISSPAEGLTVYDETSHAFYYYSNTGWTPFGTADRLTDADGDTKIQVEKSSDEDVIHFDLQGSEKMVLRQNASQNARLEIVNNRSSIFIGDSAGYKSTTGTHNTFIGDYTGYANTTGGHNTFAGALTGTSNTTGSNNTFIGNVAGYSNTTASENTFAGDRAGYANTTGSSNTFSGYQSGSNNIIGNNNTFYGHGSGTKNKASDNTFIGYSAGAANASGNQNVYVGTNTGSAATGSGNVFVGYSAGQNETGSNKLYIQNSDADSDTALIYGEFDNKILAFNTHKGYLEIRGDATHAKLKVGGTGGDAYNISSAREMVFNAVYDGASTDPLFLFRAANYNDLSSNAARMAILEGGAIGMGTETPHSSAALHIQAQRKGLLIPRMNSTNRGFIDNPTDGLLVFDISTNAFYYYNVNTWTRIGSSSLLIDDDEDTKIQVEETADEDIIHFDLGGTENVVFTQHSVGIGTGTPESSAALEIKSTNKGLLLPRMSSSNRQTISSPVEGLTVYDNTDHAFYYYSNSGWTLLGASDQLTDADGNTKIQVEENSNENIIRFDLNGAEKMLLTQNNNGVARLEIPGNGRSIYIGEGAGTVEDGGNRNVVALGYKAGSSNTSGYSNVFIGNETGNSNSSGHSNIFSGYQTGYSNTTGGRNTFSGYQAGYGNSSGHSNTYYGYQSGYTSNRSKNNTFSGYQAGHSNTASENTFSGYRSGYENTTGWSNVFSGAWSGYNNNVGSENAFFGFFSGFYSLGSANTFLGDSAGANNQMGNQNVYVGSKTGSFASGSGNVFLGYSAGRNENGSNKLYIENSSATSSNALIYGEFDNDLLTFNATVGVGTTTPNASAALEIQSTNKGLLIPRMSGSTRQGINSPAEGLLVFDETDKDFFYYANSQWQAVGSRGTNVLRDADSDTKIQLEETANENIMRFDLGGTEKMVLRKNASGLALLEIMNNQTSVFIGQFAGQANTTGYGNTYNGHGAGQSTTDGFDNTFNGHEAGKANIGGDLNSFFGSFSGTANTYGIHNTFMGAYSGASNGMGRKNTFIGYQTGESNDAGIENTYLGYRAGGNNVNGSYNVYLGVGAGQNSTGSNNVFVGRMAGGSESGSNKLYIENSNANELTALIYGEFDNNILRFNAGVGISTSGSPTGNLEIQGVASNAKLKVGGNGGDAHHISSGQDMVLNAVSDGLGSDPLFIFRSTDYSNLSSYDQRMVISENGNVVIGTTAWSNYKLQVDGTASKPGGGSWSSASDRRLKQDIKPYTDGLNELLAIQPVTFHYNEISGLDTEPEYVGVIAQELQEVAPYMVGDYQVEGSGYLDVDNSAMTYMLINAVKEQQALIQRLQESYQQLASELEDVQTLNAEAEAFREQTEQLNTQLARLDVLKVQEETKTK